MERVDAYSSIAQRAASSYLRSLVSDEAAAPEGPADGPAQRELRAFFLAFYTALFEHPDQFGLPLVADDSFVEGEPDGTEHKAELNRKLKKPRELISAGLDFLMSAGCDGQVEGQALVLAAETTAKLKKSHSLQAFLKGLEAAGLLVEVDGAARLSNPRFPRMAPALQALARACAAFPQANLGAFHFARCDFRALNPGFTPDPLDLYRIFPPADFARVSELHAYFTARQYQASVAIHSISAWLVQYQGSRQIKATPLFQVEYQERFRDPVILGIKPASTNRIAHLIPEQSQALQDDFFSRVYMCRGSECRWCRNNKTLGPTPMERNGRPVVLCWYSNPTIKSDDSTVALIEEYAEMHAKLAG
jgi:hypothetical protein